MNRAVFIDVDTQIDFLFPAGALYSPDAERIAENLAALTRFAAANRIPLVSTADAHSENDPEFQSWKPHCVVGTVGQEKFSGTRLPNASVIASHLPAPDIAALKANSQIVVEKQHVNCFTNPHFAPLAASLGDADFIVYGLVTEVCVFHAADGLLDRGRSVRLVTDAIGALDPDTAADALRSIQGKGARLVTTGEILASYGR